MGTPYQHKGLSTSPLAAALTALEALQPADETTRLAILKTLGYRPRRTTEAVSGIDTEPVVAFDTDDLNNGNRQHRGLRVVSSVDEPPPVVPSELVFQDDTGSAPPQWLDEVPLIPIPSTVSDPFSEPLAPLLRTQLQPCRH